MHRVLFVLLSSLIGPVLDISPAIASIQASRAFVNELHYDNSGADRNEFLEVAVPEDQADLSQLSVTFYNGTTGKVYRGPISLEAFERGETVGPWTFYVLPGSMQNGPRDGVALAQDGQVLQLLSYEKTFTAADGIAKGLLASDIGVAETPDTPIGHSLQLAGTGNSYEDFQWQPAQPNTAGKPNRGQRFLGQFAVPEPSGLILWGAAVAGWLLVRRRLLGS